VFFPGTCPYDYLRRAMTPAKESEPGFAVLLPELTVQPPAEAVIFALRTIRAELAQKSQYAAKTACVPFPSDRAKRYRLLTLTEARLKIRRIDAFSELDPQWPQEVARELFRETRNEGRLSKGAPLSKRFAHLIRKIVSDNQGAWTTLPSLAAIAHTLDVSVRSVQSALNHLRETSTEFSFHGEPRLDSTAASRRGRCVRVALTKWLKYDQNPLLFDSEGHERGIRSSFRQDGSLLTPRTQGQEKEVAEAPIDHETSDCEPSVLATENPQTVSFSEPLTNCNICLSDSVRLYEPAVIIPDHPRETHLQISQGLAAPATPELKGSCQSVKPVKRLAWGVARELHNCHFGDWDQGEDLGYHRWRFQIPVPVLRSIIGEALEAQIAVSKVVQLFEASCYETNAAVFDGLARNPGGLFRTVFRRCWHNGQRPTVAPAIRCSPAKEPLVKVGVERREEAPMRETPEEADKRMSKLASDFKALRLSLGK